MCLRIKIRNAHIDRRRLCKGTDWMYMIVENNNSNHHSHAEHYCLFVGKLRPILSEMCVKNSKLSWTSLLVLHFTLVTHRNKSVFSFQHMLTMWHCPQSLAAHHRAAIDQYILPTRLTAANLPYAAAVVKWDRRMDIVSLHKPCHIVSEQCHKCEIMNNGTLMAV